MQPQRSPFGFGETEAKILWKPVLIADHLLVEALDLDAVEGGQIGVEQDGLASQADNALLRGAGEDGLNGVGVHYSASFGLGRIGVKDFNVQ